MKSSVTRAKDEEHVDTASEYGGERGKVFRPTKDVTDWIRLPMFNPLQDEGLCQRKA